MNNEQQNMHVLSQHSDAWLPIEEGVHCERDTGGHCISCSDEALPATILQINQGSGLALVEIQELTEEIDITLVGDVVPGDMVLVHGGVAISLVAPSSEGIDISRQEEQHE